MNKFNEIDQTLFIEDQTKEATHVIVNDIEFPLIDSSITISNITANIQPPFTISYIVKEVISQETVN